MSESYPEENQPMPDEFDRIVNSMDDSDRERFDKLNTLNPATYLHPKPEDMPPVFEVREPLNSLAEWKARRDKYAARISRIQEIAAKTGDTSLMDTQWYGVLLGKYIVYDQQTRGFESQQKEQDDS